MLYDVDEMSIDQVCEFNAQKNDPQLSALLGLFHRAAVAHSRFLSETSRDVGQMCIAQRRAKQARADLVAEMTTTIKKMEDVLHCAKAIAYQTKRLG